MATATLLESTGRVDYGRLANNYMLVQGVQRALSRSELNAQTVPRQIRLLIAEDAWRDFLLEDGRIVHNAADFRRFIEGPRPEGCQTPIHVLRHMVKGSDVEDAVEELLRGTPGGANNHEVIQDSITGKFTPAVNRHEITVDGTSIDPPAIIPMPAAEKPARKRDYSRESKQGTSTGYTLRLLEKQAPEYLERVKAGEMSPHGAAVKAGLRDKMIGVPAVPRKAARVLARHFRGDDLAELIELLTSMLADS